MKGCKICTIFTVVAAISLLSGAGAWADDVYVRAGVGLDWSEDTRFKDKDCANHSPPSIYALYGCGSGNDGAPLSTHGDFSAPAGFELGLGHAVMPALRIEALFQYRPRFTLTGHANFLQTTGRQEVSAKVSSLSRHVCRLCGPARSWGYQGSDRSARSSVVAPALRISILAKPA